MVFKRVTRDRRDANRDADPLGLTHRAGGHHYRAYVGPPADYDLIAGLTFSLLFAAGMREGHRVLDLGCGSLRAGRLLIPYLLPGGYFGLEPNRWLVEEGIEREIGDDLVRLKRPAFRYADDFDGTPFGVSFDWVIAQSIFSHTYPDMTRAGFQKVAPALADGGCMIATFKQGRTREGSGWLYPAVVGYKWDQVKVLLAEAGLVGKPLDWPHPRQRWFIAGRKDTAEKLQTISRTLSLGRYSDEPADPAAP